MNRTLRAAPVAALVALCIGAGGLLAADTFPPRTPTVSSAGTVSAQSALGAPKPVAQLAVAPAAGADDPTFCPALATAEQSFHQAGQSASPASLNSLPASVLDGWAQIAAIAPPEIKSDAELVSDHLHRMQAGTIDRATALRELMPAIRHVVLFSAQHCPSLTATAH